MSQEGSIITKGKKHLSPVISFKGKPPEVAETMHMVDFKDTIPLPLFHILFFGGRGVNIPTKYMMI